jgi:hypothetical protein
MWRRSRSPLPRTQFLRCCRCSPSHPTSRFAALSSALRSMEMPTPPAHKLADDSTSGPLDSTSDPLDSTQKLSLSTQERNSPAQWLCLDCTDRGPNGGFSATHAPYLHCFSTWLDSRTCTACSQCKMQSPTREVALATMGFSLCQR